MGQLTIHLSLVHENCVRVYQDGFKEQVFSLEQLETALESETAFERLVALQDAKNFLEGALEGAQ